MISFMRLTELSDRYARSAALGLRLSLKVIQMQDLGKFARPQRFIVIFSRLEKFPDEMIDFNAALFTGTHDCQPLPFPCFRSLQFSVIPQQFRYLFLQQDISRFNKNMIALARDKNSPTFLHFRTARQSCVREQAGL